MSAAGGLRWAGYFSPAPPVAGAGQSAGAKKRSARLRRRLILPGEGNTTRLVNSRAVQRRHPQSSLNADELLTQLSPEDLSSSKARRTGAGIPLEGLV